MVENFQSAKEMPITIMRLLAYSRFYPKQVLGPIPYSLCPVPGYDVGKVQKLESLELCYPISVPMTGPLSDLVKLLLS